MGADGSLIAERERGRWSALDDDIAGTPGGDEAGERDRDEQQ